jgi:hypothetical protein
MKTFTARASVMLILLAFPLLVSAQTTRKITIKPDSMMLQESVMVTIEEDFGANVKTIAEALQMIERRYDPFDKQGRTFAILDAYGNKMPDGRMHISMHISSEKVGGAQLVHKTSRKLLWNCRIYPKKDWTKIAAEKQLMIYIERENEKDKYYTVNGSGNPATIYDCILDETKQSLNDYWKNNTVKEFIFIYSACGCPVHVKFLRMGFKSIFQSGDNVIFPDDPGVLTVLHKLMAW